MSVNRLILCMTLLAIMQDLWQGIDFSRSKAEARVDVSFVL